MKRYEKPYPTIKEILSAAGHDFDYVDYRIPMNIKGFLECPPEDEYELSEFSGCFKTKEGELISLDGDSYGEKETVIASEEWTMPEEGIERGLTIVMESEFVSGGEFQKMLDEYKTSKEKRE